MHPDSTIVYCSRCGAQWDMDFDPTDCTCLSNDAWQLVTDPEQWLDPDQVKAEIVAIRDGLA